LGALHYISATGAQCMDDRIGIH